MTEPISEDRTNTYRRGVTCELTAFEMIDIGSAPSVPAPKWMAVATAHVYDPKVVIPPLSPVQSVLAGETMRVISSRASAKTEAEAMALALKGLLFELTAKGFSANHELKLW